MSIFLLSDQDRDQIAAGEIIQELSDIVKELTENSIDAQATDISLEINNNKGEEYIRVRDNGIGMDEQDLEMCVKRHSTSKFISLNKINSLGFRGEGLFSISSISKMTISSRVVSSNVGVKLWIEYNQIVKKEYVSCNVGTTITVWDIFHKTPARKNFMENSTGATKKIEGVISKLALIYYKIKISVSFTRKNIQYLECHNHLQRISEVLGDNFANSLIHHNESNDTYRIDIYLQDPSLGYKDRNIYFVSVNNRPVVVNKIHQEVMSYINKHISHNSCYLIFLTVNHDCVDANMNPHKSTVRIACLEDILKTIDHLVVKTYGNKLELSAPSSSRVFLNTDLDFQVTGFELEKKEPVIYRNNTETGFGQIKTQLFDSFILTETNDGFFLIDQHAADERLVFESIKKNPLKGQNILYPEVISVNVNQSRLLEENMENMKRIGIDYEILGDYGIKIYSVPIIGTPVSDIKNFIYDILRVLANGGQVAELLEREIACHFSIKANRKLDFTKMEQLVNNLCDASGSAFCNHGRRVFIKIEKTNIDKSFGR